MSWETKKVKIVFDDDNQTKVVKGLVLNDDEHTITLKGDYDGKPITIGKRAIIKISEETKRWER